MAILADITDQSWTDAGAIAARIGAPPNYLGKLLGQLARAGLVEGRKGRGGGFRLARPASELSLYEVLEPVEALVGEDDCILGRPRCDNSLPCALHGQWERVRDEMLALLRNTRLDSLAGRID
jgi:Rrf2 family protein